MSESLTSPSHAKELGQFIKDHKAAHPMIAGVPEGLDKVMVVKFKEELPSWWKFATDYSPEPRAKVVVMGYSVMGSNTFLHVRGKNPSGVTVNCVIDSRHTRKVVIDKLRERLLAAKTTAINTKILLTL